MSNLAVALILLLVIMAVASGWFGHRRGWYRRGFNPYPNTYNPQSWNQQDATGPRPYAGEPGAEQPPGYAPVPDNGYSTPTGSRYGYYHAGGFGLVLVLILLLILLGYL